MKRLASLVLRHKLLVVLTWLTLAVAGFATISTTTHWMTATFALPGQPGYVTDTRIAALYHNGGGQTPTVLTLTVPALNQAAPLRSLPDSVTDLDHFRVQRRDRAGGVLHEYHLVT